MMWHARAGESEESWSQGQDGQAGAASGAGGLCAGVSGGRDTGGGRPAVTAARPPGVRRTAGTASAAAGAPTWVDDLARVTPGACHVTEDEFGETLAVLCEFSYRGETGPHCVFGVIDRAWHGAVTALVVADVPGDKQLGRME